MSMIDHIHHTVIPQEKDKKIFQGGSHSIPDKSCYECALILILYFTISYSLPLQKMQHCIRGKWKQNLGKKNSAGISILFPGFGNWRTTRATRNNDVSKIIARIIWKSIQSRNSISHCFLQYILYVLRLYFGFSYLHFI